MSGPHPTDQKPHRLTDRPALEAHRRRALRQAGGMADFLHRAVARDLQERLESVNRRFTEVAVVSGYPKLWDDLWPGARHLADTEVLDLQPGSLDLVLHVLALHWADDPVGQLIQCRRALRPDGLMLAASFGGETLAVLRAALAQAESEVTGGLSPRVAPMGEIRDLGALVQRAGFAQPVADSQAYRVSYATPFHLMRDLRAMGETNALAARHRVPARRALFARAAEIYAQQSPAEAEGAPDGRVAAVFEVITLAGWAAHDSQQRPLRPGSAAQRLADALGAEERILPGDGE